MRYTQFVLKTEEKGIDQLLARVRKYLPEEKLPGITQAYEFAQKCHEGQTRLSGEPFVEHPLQTALILADLQLDAATIASALLHDVIEDCGVRPAELESKFGPEITKLVDGTTKLARLTRQASENLRRRSHRFAPRSDGRPAASPWPAACAVSGVPAVA